MAKVTFGPIVAEVRGRQGNLVFNRNQWGAYTRPYTAPLETVTARRTIIWNRFQAAVAAWRVDLTSTQRLNWESYAGNINKKDIFGQEKRWTGRHAFLSSFCYLDTLGLMFLTDPPGSSRTFSLTTAAATLNTDTPTMPLTLTWDQTQDQPAAIIFASPPMNPTRNSPAGTLQQIAALSDAESYPYNLWTDYIAVFGTPPTTSRIFFQATPINPTTGLAGAKIRAHADDTGTGDAMLQRTVTLTDAQIKALPTTTFEIIPTPGPNKYLAPIHAVIVLDATAASYDLALGDPGWQFTDPADLQYWNATCAMAAALTTAAKTITHVAFPIYAQDPTKFSGLPYTKLFSGGSTPANLANQPLVLRDDWTTGGNYTLGDPANSCTITIFYTIVDIP